MWPISFWKYLRWLTSFWKYFRISLDMDKLIVCRSILMSISRCSGFFPPNFFNLNFTLRVLLWLIISSSCVGFLRTIQGQRLTLEDFTSLLSWNYYFSSIWKIVVPLVMLLGKRTLTGPSVSMILLFKSAQKAPFYCVFTLHCHLYSHRGRKRGCL